jgi:polysaccharide biosynthesis/export protein
MKIITMFFLLVVFSTVFPIGGRAESGGAGKKLVPTEAAASGPAPTLLQEREPNPQQAIEKSSLIVTRDYIIGPEDVLDITVWRNQDLSKVVQVRPDGRISLPLIGDVTAVGKTPTQLTADISSKLKDYKEAPTVAIIVREVNSYAIFVLGEVGKPGKFPLKSKTTLLQGITIAGGFTATAARNKVVVFRFNDTSNGSLKLKASYDDIVLRDGGQQNIELKPGDTIVVPSETMVLLP